MEQKFLKLMLDFVRESGALALDLRRTMTPSLKQDHSVITEADRQISALSGKYLKDYLKDDSHVLIEEEDPERGKYLDKDFLSRKKYVWSVDPVDGTRLYANHMPLFGVSIGLMKDLKPWMGAVYFPALKELFYCDGTDSFFAQNAFTSEEQKKKILPVDMEISEKTLFLLSDLFFQDYQWDYKDLRLLITACAVVDICWPAVGRGVGCFDQSHLWDFAGSWPIARSAGLEFRHWQTGKLLDALDADLFKTENSPWQLKDFYILSSERNFPLLKNKITELPQKH